MSADFDAQILTRTVWLEAEGEPFEGKLAVAHSILNRWKSRKWFAGATIAATCLKRKQYSGWNTDEVNGARRERMASLDFDQMKDCHAAAMAAILGTVADPTGNATHYHARSIKPEWAHDQTPCYETPGHIFYKDIP